jgi:hypothetical protein
MKPLKCARDFHWKVSLLSGQKHKIDSFDIQAFHSLRRTVRYRHPRNTDTPPRRPENPKGIQRWIFWMFENAPYFCFRIDGDSRFVVREENSWLIPLVVAFFLWQIALLYGRTVMTVIKKWSTICDWGVPDKLWFGSICT